MAEVLHKVLGVEKCFCGKGGDRLETDRIPRLDLRRMQWREVLPIIKWNYFKD